MLLHIWGEQECVSVGSSLQVKSGTIFDNVLITDDEDLASQFAEETFSVTKDGEKKMKEKVCVCPY